MPHLIGAVDDSNGQLAHYNLLETIKDFATSNGWQSLRYNTTIENRELILKGTGDSGDDSIYLCFYCYQSAANDVYNLAVGVAMGYIPDNAITNQPNVVFSGVPLHNRRIDYWLTLNPQRMAGVLKVGTPVYESFYLGKFLPFAMPHQYPLPMLCAGMLNGAPLTRFSDTSHSIPYKGNRNNLRMWFNSGEWKTPETWPWNNGDITGETAHFNNMDMAFTLQRITLNDNYGCYGTLDGIAHITGFDNVVENMITIGTDNYLVVQDVARTGANDYYVMKLED